MLGVVTVLTRKLMPTSTRGRLQSQCRLVLLPLEIKQDSRAAQMVLETEFYTTGREKQ